MKKQLVAALVVAGFAAASWLWIAPGQQSETAMKTSEPTPTGQGAPLAEVMIPEQLSAKAEAGKTYYAAVCATCHGVNAAGQDGVAPPLVHRVYEPSHHGDMAFVLAARNGVRSHHWRFGNMPPVEQRLTDAELGAIVAYVRELQRANGIN